MVDCVPTCVANRDVCKGRHFSSRAFVGLPSFLLLRSLLYLCGGSLFFVVSLRLWLLFWSKEQVPSILADRYNQYILVE